MKAIFEDRVAKGTVRGRDGVSVHAIRADLDAVTRYVSVRCRAGSYQFTTYRPRLLLKGAGKPPREISIPTVRDRIALRALTELLAETFPNCVGKLPQTEVAAVAKDLDAGNFDSFVRIDVKNFYPSIDHEVLLRELATRIRSRAILRVVRRAIATPTAPDRSARPTALLSAGVPQGLSISNPLAEIYMRSVDTTMASMSNVSYHRFVDDILVLCQASDAQAIDDACRLALGAIKLSAHPSMAAGKSEIGLIADGFTYLGYTFSSAHVSVRLSSIVRLESHLASIYAKWRQEREGDAVSADTALRRLIWHRNLAITGCIFQGVASGWIQYFRQLDDLMLLKRLDATVSRLSKRYSVPKTPLPKTFMRAYWAIKHPRSRSEDYIPNFDLYDVPKMRLELEAMGITDAMGTDQQVQDKFFRIVSRAVRDLEHDIGDVS
ncbi:reverse transcriptase domain-containing protein [Angustibacter sp. Root456]|uniref:reverse transcriptase domain-containing protein n=1 Tax=Angustibacter sp. Root456 TaxID=1736539 RepID=UPI00138F350F|nr:reverse transcriptase domain-containing protein [Angustibacter sp. Root456]